MRQVKAVILSRRGCHSVPAEVWHGLNTLADVRVLAGSSPPDPAVAADLLADADVLASTNRCLPELSPTLLGAAPRLRHLVLYATGYDHLDLGLLARHDITLTTLPEYATDAVAEHALAMLMAMATRLHVAHDRGRRRLPADVSLRGIELRHKTVGVAGVGRIGSRVAQLCAALGMNVIGCDIDSAAVDRARQQGISMGSLTPMLRRADAVVLCASHRFGAPPIIGPAQLALLPPHGFLVNVARSALVDTDATIGAIRAGTLRGYAVDDEIVDPDRHGDLLNEGRILQTGHSAWWRDEVLERGSRMWGDAILTVVRRLTEQSVEDVPSEVAVSHPAEVALSA